jgi:hypothetical protein
MAIPPALIDSRLGVGTLTIATIDRSYQIANVRLEPDISEEDGTPTLAQPDPVPLATVGWTLSGTAIQDFEAGAESFVNYLMDHALEEVAFEFVPDSDAVGLQYTGTVQLRPTTIGGDAGVQITSDFELPVIGVPARTDPTGLAAATSSSKRSSS